MNFIKYRFTQFHIGANMLSIKRIVWPIFKKLLRFIKFNKLHTYRLFIAQVFFKMLQQIIQLLRRLTPSKLALSATRIIGSINKMNRATKSLQNPVKYGSLCIITLQNNLINRIRSVSHFIFLNAQRTFSIYKSSEIGKVIIGRNNSTSSRFKNILLFFINEIAFFFKNMHFFYKSCISFFNKLHRQQSFFFLFNKIRKQFGYEQFRSFLSKGPAIKITRISRSFGSSVYRSTKSILKVKKCAFINRRYENVKSIFWRPVFSWYAYTNVKTAITIYITCCVCIIPKSFSSFHIENISKNPFKVNEVTETDNPTNISGSDIERVQRALIGNNAWTVTEHIAGEDRYATAPVRNAFVAMCHTDLIADLDAIPNFTNKANYANYDKSMVSEWGVYRNVRFFVSTIGSVDHNASALGQNVYNVLTVGLEAYACIKQNLASAKFIYRDPLLNDPLGQNASAGYKFASAQTILHDEWVQRLRCTVA